MSAQTKPKQRLSRVRRLLRHPLWSPLNQRDAWDRLTTAVNPLWSLMEARARVIKIIDEAPGVKSLWLKPNARFKGFRPGQHVLLELEINGARHARCFSFSSAPRADGLIRLTIKQKANGPVSATAHALKAGQIVRLSQAQGTFFPRETFNCHFRVGGNDDSLINHNFPDNKLLLLSAGSGVTPMLSLLQSYANEKSERDIVMLHCGHLESDIIFADELQQLALQLPKLNLFLHVTKNAGHLTEEKIAALVPDWHERGTLLCGPDGFMQTVEAMYAKAGRSDCLQSESFGRRAAPIDPNADSHEISATNPEHLFTVQSGQSLLDGAEAAGLQPKFGCRRGICRSCQCKKLSGTVTNLLTGQVSGPGEELIQLCISTPQSAVELVL